MNICAREVCGLRYVKKTHNQKYCCDDCCKIATNARMKENYYKRKAQKSGKARLCESCEETKLSRYNSGVVCSPCLLKSKTESTDSIKDMISLTAWQL